MSEYMIPIPSRVYNAAVDGHVAGADQIIDDKTGLTLDKVAGGALEEKEYTSSSNNGMGRVVLRKNLVEGVNTLTQSMINQANTIYVIQYDFTLGEDITVPDNCVLEFDGGSLNGTYLVNGNSTIIYAGLVKIFNINVTLAGTWNVAEAYPEWFGAKGDGVTDDVICFQKCSDLLKNGGTLVFQNKIYALSSDNYRQGEGSAKVLIPVYSGMTIKSFCGTLYIIGASDCNVFATHNVMETGTIASIVTEHHDSITFKDFNIEGNLANLKIVNSLTGLYIKNTDNVIIENVNIKNLWGILGYGYGCIFVYCTNVSHKNCKIERTDRSNIYVEETKNYCAENLNLLFSYFRDNFTIGSFAEGGASNYILQPSSFKLSNCICNNPIDYESYDEENPSDHQTYAIRCAGMCTGVIERCTINTTKHVGITILNGNNSTTTDVCDIAIKNCIINSSGESGIGVNIAAEHINKKIILDGNKIYGKKYGVISNATRTSFVIENNEIKSDYFTINIAAPFDTFIKNNKIICGKGSNNISPFNSLINIENNYIDVENLTESFSFIITGYGDLQKSTFSCFGNILSSPFYLRTYLPTIGIGNINLKFDTDTLLPFNVTAYGPTSKRPTLVNDVEIGIQYYDTSLRRIIYWNGNTWVDEKGFTANKTKGPTSDRPTGTAGGGTLYATRDEGFCYYDTTINKPIYVKTIAGDGTITWIDATGVTV